ncbi:MAG: histidine--tRNA ligase, partial [Mogibacterium diversum]|nr:histidine--tRNA ligase [Mogibacterium diversum]
LILMEQNDIIVDDPNVPDISVSFIGDKARLYALDLVHKLRACGVSAIIDTLNRNLKGQMKYANKLNARYSVVIGENEIEKGIVTLKNMNSGEQKEINAIDITKEIEK